MKKQILFTRRLNENATSRMDPVKVYVKQTDEQLLSLEGSFCLCYDDDRFIMCKLYEVKEIDLPEWLSPDEWCRDNIKWTYFWAHLQELKDSLSPEVQRKLFRFSGAQLLAIVGLLNTKNFRSEFRKSLRNQLDAWLSSEVNAYDSPFSPKQWNALCDARVKLQSQRIDRNVYAIENTSENQDEKF